jgi:hypothetical protein
MERSSSVKEASQSFTYDVVSHSAAPFGESNALQRGVYLSFTIVRQKGLYHSWPHYSPNELSAGCLQSKTRPRRGNNVPTWKASARNALYNGKSKSTQGSLAP